MRRIVSFLLCAVLVFSLVSCGGNEEPQSSAAPESTETALPESSEPGNGEPESSEPESSEPESFDPESSEPESSEPESSDPESGEPESSDPESSEPESSEPVSSETDQPVASTKTVKTTTRKTATRRTVGFGNNVNNTSATATTTAKTTTRKTATRRTVSSQSNVNSTSATTTTTKPSYILPTSGDWEKPVTVNTAVLYNEKHSSYDDEAEGLRQRILNAKDTVKAADGCNTYYISYRGDDKNSGLSAKTPWLSADNLSAISLKKGDVVLFERGGIYRGMKITMVSGVSYGAYGEGPKPQLYGGDKNYAEARYWTEYSDNVWRIKVPADKGNWDCDIGNIVFDHGEICASDYKVLSLRMLRNDYNFYHDTENDYVYLYLSEGNPGELHKSIEIVPGTDAFYGRHINGCTVENMCIKYYQCGVHGIDAKNITVRGCEIGYTGGNMQIKYHVRSGGGIGFESEASDVTVEGCWVYQAFDAGYTNQGNSSPKRIVIRDNLIEYCLYNLEIWVDEADVNKLTDCSYENNVLRFAGYGFGSNNRFGSSTMAAGNFSTCVQLKLPCENVTIKNNVFDSSYRYVVRLGYPNDSQGRGPVITNNTWIQQPFDPADNNASILATNAKDPAAPSVGVTAFTGGEIIRGCRTLSEMKESVALFDKDPTAVILEK